jgi:hypothetical protein
MLAGATRGEARVARRPARDLWSLGDRSLGSRDRALFLPRRGALSIFGYDQASKGARAVPTATSRATTWEETLKLPAGVLFRKKLSLFVWKPRGILDETVVKEIIAFVAAAEAKSSTPFSRFADLSALDAIDLNFKFVFHIALHRRVVYASQPPTKSAFYVTSPASVHYAKLHAMLTDYSPLHVALFTERAAAAEWLGVPEEALIQE